MQRFVRYLNSVRMWEMRCNTQPTKKVCRYYDYLREQINEKASECLDAGLISGIYRLDLGKGNTAWDFESDFNGAWFDRYIYVEANEESHTSDNETEASNNSDMANMKAFLKSRAF